MNFTDTMLVLVESIIVKNDYNILKVKQERNEKYVWNCRLYW